MPFDTVYSYSNPRVRKLSDEQRREAVQLYEQGWAYQQIGAKFGVSASAIVYHVTRRTVLRRDRPRRPAEKRPSEELPTVSRPGKLSDEQRTQAVARVQSGESIRVVAQSLGVSDAAIAYHVRKAREAVQ
ncbi:helix-turn-helix domain-containing protein [Phycicoccus sp.]|uniref:helix-turn-helix domain-containing protein n=1 Tax=Phycicoccus sp. TaxID=1902410 RepID=UPI002CA44F7A|nr:helix-turn-helix domain-containing protein [Phycicoccus sp.]HMM95423.1 helix-turn-helix domain-containing protein [Phycicoccus sp.]